MKVPLLEYLDKLEADVRRTDQHSTMHQPHSVATLALIAKLREAIRAVRVIADGDAEAIDWKVFNEIEVPE